MFCLPETLDRLREAIFWRSSMDRWYHQADRFRWHLYAFLKALKEVPTVLQMEMNKHPGFTVWFATYKNEIYAHPAIMLLHEVRDRVVHEGAVHLENRCAIGTYARNRAVYLDINLHPCEDSDRAMRAYLSRLRSSADFLGIFNEGACPHVRRFWNFPDSQQEAGLLCTHGLRAVTDIVDTVHSWLTGGSLHLPCWIPEASDSVCYRFYDPLVLRKIYARHQADDSASPLPPFAPPDFFVRQIY